MLSNTVSSSSASAKDYSISSSASAKDYAISSSASAKDYSISSSGLQPTSVTYEC